MTLQTTKTVLLTSILATVAVLSVANHHHNYAFADHDHDTSTWPTDKTYDIQSSLYAISHYSYTPTTEFDAAAAVWNGVSGSWWDITRDNSNGDIDVMTRSFSWLSSDLAVARAFAPNGVMVWAQLEFNSNKDFRDVTISSGWWSYDFKTVAIHEIGHLAGIHEHTETSGSPMVEYIAPNYVDRTLNSHDRATIRGMY